MGRKPLIGITCNYETRDKIGIITEMGVKKQKWQFLADNYINAIERAGGIPVMLPVYEKLDTAMELLEGLDGVVISGGNDVSPVRYGEEPKENGEIIPERDEQDIAIASYLFNEKNIPVLGICRGLQVINAMAGGTMHQDLEKAGYGCHSMDESPMNTPVHGVKLTRGTKLSQIYGVDGMRVNSYHHSAVKEPAQGWTISAVSAEDGVTEALECPEKRFFLAVQWHPEMMYDDKLQKKLFEAFITACKGE